MTISVSLTTLQIMLFIICSLCLLRLVYAVVTCVEHHQHHLQWSMFNYIASIILAICLLSIISLENRKHSLENRKHEHQVDQLPEMWRELYRQAEKVEPDFRNKFVADAIAKYQFPPCSKKELRRFNVLGISASSLERFINDNPEFHIPEQK